MTAHRAGLLPGVLVIVILGLLGMHALVTLPAGSAHETSTPAPTSVGAAHSSPMAPATAPMVMGPTDPMPAPASATVEPPDGSGHTGPTRSLEPEPASAPGPASAVTVFVGVVADMVTGPIAQVAGQRPSGHGDHGMAEHILHLCVVVLAAIGIALLAAWHGLARRALPTSSPQGRHRTRGIPAERPPPVPRRLAQLCVLRT